MIRPITLPFAHVRGVIMQINIYTDRKQSANLRMHVHHSKLSLITEALIPLYIGTPL